jgi:hypothetical protein
MSIRSFAAGILAGLVLGGVAWAGHESTEGVLYYVHSGSAFERGTKYLEQARGDFVAAREDLKSRPPRQSFIIGVGKVTLVEQTCTSRVLDSYNR